MKKRRAPRNIRTKNGGHERSADDARMMRQLIHAIYLRAKLSVQARTVSASEEEEIGRTIGVWFAEATLEDHVTWWEPSEEMWNAIGLSELSELDKRCPCAECASKRGKEVSS